MKTRLIDLTQILTLTLVLAGCAATREPAPAPAAVAQPTIFDKYVEHDRILVAGQPSEADLRRLKEMGYTRIVNVRTQAEMDDRAQVPYDEAALAAELGLGYVLLPIGGDTPFRPEVLDGLKQALGADQGRVLLHCTVGMRASLVYAGYAVKYLGADPDAALRDTAIFDVWPIALERLTGVKLKVVRAEE